MDIRKPPWINNEEFIELNIWLEEFWTKLLEEDIRASATWDPGSIAGGNEEATDVTCTGAEVGDYAIASFSNDVSDLTLDAQVTAADTVTCVLANNTGGAIDLSSGTVYVRVFRRTT